MWLRDYVPVTERKEGNSDYQGEDMGKVPPSNAYQRRVAGTHRLTPSVAQTHCILYQVYPSEARRLSSDMPQTLLHAQGERCESEQSTHRILLS